MQLQLDDRWKTALLLLASNSFMTVAWYGHLRFKKAPLILAVLVSWGIAFFFAAMWLGEGVQPRYLVSFGLIFAAVVVAFR